MDFRNLDKIAKLELSTIIVLVILGVLWMLDPEGLYEPFFVFCGLVFVCTEFYRRYKVEDPKKPESPDTIYKLGTERKKVTTFIKKVKPDGAIAQCPSQTCNTIAQTAQEAEVYFGYRTIKSGEKRIQSYCKKCRTV
ncbi:hypothetical protein [Pseudoalteromonas obscura]|uniref:Uncharacterized protein n=2 Tax=Pseudoalteromonas TaxID=53246 RepID=A0ABT7EFH7_9GAMM|nr:hypothetical protein [Pseudoalteromonas sp. P94(2023)]MDK2594042.1 hypothetical protein [Pseudoalteromonas sp. P94(2023)]